MTARTTPIVDILIIAAVSAITFMLEAFVFARGWLPFGEELRGVFSVIAGAIAVLWLVRWGGGSYAELGFKRPKRWSIVPLQVLAILVAFIAGQALVPLLVSSFVEVPAPDLSRYDAVAGNLPAAIGMALLLPITASIPEEIIYRGFLIGRLSTMFGHSGYSAALAVGVQGLIFGAIHFQWGIGGMLTTTIMGIIWGTAYLLCDRNLWVVILAHSAGHILLVIQLYLAEPLIL